MLVNIIIWNISVSISQYHLKYQCQCIQEWVRERLCYDSKQPCQYNKQLIIFQYTLNNDQTDIHPLQLQDQMDKLLHYPTALIRIRKLLNY